MWDGVEQGQECKSISGFNAMLASLSYSFFIYDIDVSMSCITVLLNAMLCTHVRIDMPFNHVIWEHPTSLSHGFSVLSLIFLGLSETRIGVSCAKGVNWQCFHAMGAKFEFRQYF
jgi:hypothetical protein